ncbi:hypothetical protein KVT40_003650 [Elsinoe batatas]|uniref:C2H2-type domain-containing protein n=1 Tax=Elsinoe batatas TaxID=2601811 RepID=A0A8K0L2D2_9PEZI|nr:hypothetical protein KVT40_003650 [Elsinoe batatas]
MAPANYNYNTWNGGYDNRQQANNPSYGYGNNVSNNDQYGGSSTATYQPNSYQQTPTAQSSTPNAAYGRGWNYQPSQNESRAAETLSALSAQEPAPYSSTATGTNQGYGNGAWDPAQQRPASSVAQSTASAQSYDSAYSRGTQQTYSTTASTQPSTYTQDSSYAQNSTSNVGYQYSRTSQAFNPVNDARSRSNAGQSAQSKQKSAASPRIQQNGRASPAITQAQNVATYAAQRPSTSGHQRVQSVTPTQLQQQARNAPPPLPAAPAQATIDPTQVYDPWPEQKRAAEKAAEERKRKEAEQTKAKAAEEAAERERKRKDQEKAAAEHKRQRGIEQAKALTASALDAAMNAADANGTSTGNAMEEEMRAMFQKMRQFNAANPKLLAKLWEEERQAHVTKPGSEQESASAPSQIDTSMTPAPAASPASDVSKAKRGSAKKAASTPKAPKAPKANKPAAVKPSETATSASPAPSSTTKKIATESAKAQSAPVAESPVAAATTAASAQSSTSIWPPGRKQLLAETGAKWLNGRKENTGKSIKAEQLAELLNGNPSYPNLCTSIEAMGIHLDRSAFARTLLTAVPDLNKPNATVASVVRASAAATTAPAALESPVVPGPSQATIIGHSGIAPEAPMFNGAYRPQQPAPSPAPAVKPPPPQNAYLNKLNSLDRPLTKEETARKRVYEQLQLLTNLEDESDDGMPPPPKIQNTGQYGEFSSIMAPPPVDGHQQFGQQPVSAPQPLESRSFTGKNANPKLAELRNQIIVQPLRREKAARRSTYDPRTIARDVLLATGRHPEMRPLNGHLMGMQGLLAHHTNSVEGHKYDLATIRWDLIDPGEPLPDSEDDRSDDGSEADDESDTLSTSALARPNVSIPRALDAGDGTMTMAPAILQPTLKGTGKKKPRGRPPRFSAPGGMQTMAGANNGDNHKSQSNGTPQPRKNAGPPGSAPSGDRTGTPTGGTPSGGPTGYAALRAQAPIQYDEHGNQVKRRGRPIGWRKAIHSKEAHGQGSSGPSTQRPKSNMPSQSDMKRRGRPPAERQNREERAPSPRYNSYHCRWEQCNAELHNLDTLRKHVLKIHGIPFNKILTCRWTTCGAAHAPDTKGKAPTQGHHEFPTIDRWMTHVENAHILPLAQTLGDGPRSGLSDAYDSETSQAYLSDASGRIITPRATPLADVAEEDERQGNNLAPILRRGMPRVRGTLSQDQKDDEYKLQQLEAKKLMLGPLWDKGGATLVTDKRRRGLYDDEDFEEETEADDGPEWEG